MAVKQSDNRGVMIKGILTIHRKLLNEMDDMELTTMLIRAWRLQGAKPGDTEPMGEIDIGYVGGN